jgi:acetyltransferase-like isoleucine patch superfamily enzyme
VTIAYLVKNREKPGIFTPRWFKVWAKRIVHFPALLGILFCKYRCQLRGAVVGQLSIIEDTQIHGNLKNLQIGDFSIIAKSVNLALHAPIKIGSNVVLNGGVQILTASHDLKDPGWSMYKKEIVIGDYAWIATGAIVLPGVTIGRGAVVGAGAVVRQNVPDFAVASGNPAVIQLDRRVRKFSYAPTAFSAPYEAWLGKKEYL